MDGIILGTIGIFITIIIGLFPNPIRDFFIEKFGEPLKVQPSSKKISFSKDGDNWNEEFFVYLVNNTNHTYYDINIVSSFLYPINVNIFPDNSNETSFIGQRDSGVMVGLDFSITGESKDKKLKICQTVINNIGPNEKRKIKIIINKNNYTKDFKLKFKISNFNKKPKPIFKK